LSRYLQRDFTGAEELLRGCVAEEFELPSTFCHLTRVLLMMIGTEKRAKRPTMPGSIASMRLPMSWPHLVPSVLFAILDGAEFSAVVGQIKSVLRRSAAQSEWTFVPCSITCRHAWANPITVSPGARRCALQPERGASPQTTFPSGLTRPQSPERTRSVLRTTRMAHSNLG